MPEAFLALEPAEQADVLNALAPRLGRAPTVLEKDIWVCWVLSMLFTMPERGELVFKGGTSLSKAYGIIERFSEDVDVTWDFRGYQPGFDPFAAGVSKTRQKAFGAQLKARVSDFVKNRVAPRLREALTPGTKGEGRVEADADGESLRLYYPSVLAQASGYQLDHVLIEFGGRNVTDPSEEIVVRPDIAALVPDVVLPAVTVRVLSPSRTFWEKATLIHAACHRGNLRAGADRLSRHWYDLVKLAGTDYGSKALADRHLLADVVRHKDVFYPSSNTRYDLCLTGSLRLIPDPADLAGLEADYEGMVAAGMFYGKAVTFTELLDSLQALEASINSGVTDER